ncbi:MAG: hypothetical protein ACK4P3_01075 [Fimbriimonadaceae bacterium]
MQLNEFAASRRMAIYESLRAGQPPTEGDFNAQALKDAMMLGAPQMGATNYSPETIEFQFIYPDPNSAPVVFSVTIPSPQRIVFMPVPNWVIESIWQGEIDGSYQFESDAQNLLSQFTAQLEPEANKQLFGKKRPTRRE